MKYLAISFVCVFTFCFLTAVYLNGGRVAEAPTPLTHPTFSFLSTDAPKLTAESWLVFDIETGEIILKEKEKEVFPIASVTKLMTAHIVVGLGSLETASTVTAESLETEGESGRLSLGESISRREALFPLILESSNDASEVLARTGKDRTAFILAMNDEARRLGMESAVFADPSGLSKENKMNVEDLARLVRHMFLHERYVFDISTLSRYRGERHGWLNNNPLAHTAGYLGGKHGFTDEAGRTFAGVFSQAFKDAPTREVGIIFLHSDHLSNDMALLRTFIENTISYALVSDTEKAH